MSYKILIKDFFLILKKAIALAAFLVGSFLSIIIPKNKKIISFFCNEAGLFGGNIKPLCLYGASQNQDKEIVVISFNKKTIEEIRNLGLKAYYYPTPKAIWVLLRSGLIIIECGLRLDLCGLCFRSKVVQLWHGANLKYMVKGWYPFENIKNPISKVNRWIKINVPKYEFILSPSNFYKENTFSKSFNAKQVFVSGYPRNDLFFREERPDDFVGSSTEIIKKAKQLKLQGKKIILYVPTWRDWANRAENVIPFDQEKLIHFVEDNQIYLVVKKHHRDNRTPIPKNHSFIDIYPHDQDIYLLMKYADLLITDYSSIFFDFLLLKKPIVFYPFDYETYVKRDRRFQYPYDDFTPGKKCLNEDELYSEIITALKTETYYSDDSKKILELAFDKEPCTNSCEKIWDKCLEVLNN